MSSTLVRAAALAAALLAAATAAEAKGPVNVEANSMEINEGKNQAVFKGGVVATREGETMKADVMVVDYADAKQADGTTATEVGMLNATGNVTINTRTQVITGEAARMDVQANKLVVTGNVRVVQGKTVLVGQKLDVDLDTNKTLMTGGRVRGTFVPK
jgi:lipopolysaccharide export system protein LptA